MRCRQVQHAPGLASALAADDTGAEPCGHGHDSSQADGAQDDVIALREVPLAQIQAAGLHAIDRKTHNLQLSMGRAECMKSSCKFAV